MDNFGKHLLIPSAVAVGLFSLGYLYQKKKNITGESNFGSLQNTVTTVSEVIYSSDVQIEKPTLSEPSNPVFTEGGVFENAELPKAKSVTNYAPSRMKHTTNLTKHKLSPNAMQTVHGMENKFFSGLDKKANLSCDELNQIVEHFLPTGTDERKTLPLKHILHEMRRKQYFTQGYYKSKINHMFQTINIKPSQVVLDHLDLFEETIQKIIEADLEKTMKEFQYDIVLVFSDDDHQRAVQFCKHMEFKLPHVKIISLSDMDGNKTELRSMENVFNISTYLFILVSTHFTKDDLKRYICEISLTESLQNPQAKWRVVPIWLDRNAKKNGNCPWELRPLKGINYFHILENKCNYSMGSVTECIQKLIVEGRENILPTSSNELS